MEIIVIIVAGIMFAAWLCREVEDVRDVDRLSRWLPPRRDR